MSRINSGHVSSDRLGEAAQHASLDSLRDAEKAHVEGCERCRQLYAGYRLTDRLLAADWRQTALPASINNEKPIRTGLLGFLDGWTPKLSPRSLVPAALALSLVVLIALGVLLPQFMPTPSPAASGSQSAVVSPSATSAETPDDTASLGAFPLTPPPVTGKTSAPGGAKTPGKSSPTPQTVSVLAALPGWPVAWAPDGAHLMTSGAAGWTNQRQIQILDPSGRLVGSFNADSATWVDSNTIAAASHGKGPGGSTTISLVGLDGHVIATLPGNYVGGGAAGAVLLGSGTGLVAIASKGDWGPSQSSFVIWDGHTLGASHAGMPIAFSRDGKKLAVLHPSGGYGGSSSGWLEVVSVATLRTIVANTRTTLRVVDQGNGPGYAPDASFSPDGNWLYAAGTLVDLSRGSTTRVGEGGWLPDGSLLTSNGGVVLRWQGSRSTADARFAAGGSVVTSRHGDVVEYFSDARVPLLITAGGTVRQLKLSGVLSLDDAQLSPTGGAIAFTGRNTSGGRVTDVAKLT